MSAKKVLFLDLKKKSSETKNYPDLDQYLGGLGISLYLFWENINHNPLIFSRGPLTGAFPFTNKVSIFFKQKNNLREIYGLGNFGPMLAFAGYDAIVILNKAIEPLRVKINNEAVVFETAKKEKDSNDIKQIEQSSSLEETEGKAINDNFFSFGEFLGSKFQEKALCSLTISGNGNLIPDDVARYEKIYEEIFSKKELIQTEKAFLCSCFGCPLGCQQAQKEEFVIFKLKKVPYSSLLLFCSLATPIFKDFATIFSCLSSLGYNYTHEDLEALPEKIWKLREELHNSYFRHKSAYLSA